MKRIAGRKPDGRMNGRTNKTEDAVDRHGYCVEEKGIGAAKKIFFSVFLLIYGFQPEKVINFASYRQEVDNLLNR